MGALIGQRTAETLLARAILQDRVGHAYLFLGPAGVGKATAARLFARALNCEQQPAVEARPPGGDGTPGPEALALRPCDRCRSCRLLLSGTHPEFVEIHPESRAGQNISVEQARDVRRNAALRPRLGHRRVYLFPNAEWLNEVSANALLKTLEEPSPFVTLILCAPSPSQVLPTIRSRCQLVRFGLVPTREIAAALVAEGVEPERAEALARASGGRPGRALSWARHPAALERRLRVLALFQEALALHREARERPGLAVSALALAERLRALAEEARSEDPEGGRRPGAALAEDLTTGLDFIRDLIVLRESGDPALVRNPELLQPFREWEGISPAHLLDCADSVREAQQLLERHVTPQAVLERLFWALIAGRLPVESRLYAEVFG